MTWEASRRIGSGLSLLLALLAFAPTVAVAAPPANDDFADAQEISLPAAVTGTNVDATLEVGEPNPHFVVSGQSVWYRFATSVAQPLRIVACGSGFDTVVGLFRGNSFGDLVDLAGDGDGCASTGIRASVEAGTPYWIVVRGKETGQGTFTLTVGPPPPPPPPPPPTPAPACPAPNSPAGAVGYAGTHDRGGRVCLTVLGDFSAVTSFQMTDVPFNAPACNVAHRILTYTPPLFIDNRTFVTYDDWLEGQFGLDRTVQGSFELRSSYFEFIPCTSGIVRWNATTTATPPWVTPPADTTGPRLRLGGPAVQRPLRRGRIVVRARCPQEACKARATATVAGIRLRSAETRLRAGVARPLTLRIPRAARRAIRTAVRPRRGIRRTVTVVARDTAGNRTTARRTLRLRR